MVTSRSVNSFKTPCQQCPLRPLPHFREFSRDELEFVSSFKRGELAVDAGSTILVEGAHSAHLFTVLAGWGFRYKMLEDGRRQILNYIMPGDLIGLQGTIAGEMQHSVEALSPVSLCVFERDRLMTLYNKHPSLAFDITWIAAREERILDEHLLSIGRRTALERAAYLIAFLFERGRKLNLFNGRKFIPITQQHIADTLGLSIVHTNKTLKKLGERRLIRWQERGCEVLNGEELMAIAGWEGLGEGKRPFI
ncbi:MULTISPECIES: Crp/Fnr family transcriptional regulator [unclassified Rhizobium]|uniref:Crp/Fnr family transcriptional regulator n=1 Tax=unclassified Rhizobium TaxID=2613769 RepID=UPI001A98F018|nr:MULTISPECIES: Crp/Fnr family transcriptional regulator [unclassified Rhizobium]MBX5157307.1 Crp/Fnr family transcriptional regulator [Rhizobium sp. NZLR8]MBX5163036.1 Crp/Fnr family transcriptional regulator [Rhizobium sp. NZLR4b]MBX5168975.1 Crp/Fnr family transcriptional regulator [Rhizobium sp. NZLR1b]MBX5184045.1 Crp/Fnr family transcriptional regulator [Rhizobium sp. NZLR5]MBX5188918.1 Crp/Fnr family transcriptional regulator [Rhizobium sp. NZLR3b]